MILPSGVTHHRRVHLSFSRHSLAIHSRHPKTVLVLIPAIDGKEKSCGHSIVSST